MKKISKHLIFLVIFLFVGLNSCTEDLEEINEDPNAFTDATPELLLPGVMKSQLDLVGGVMNFWMYLQYGRYSGGMSGNAMQTFGFFIGFVDSYWQRLYIEALKPAREVQDLYADNPEYHNRVQIAKGLEAWIFSVILSTWGPAPVSDAVGESTFKIPFDDEVTGYSFILNKLEEAADQMASSPSNDVLLSDPMFGGDNEKWLRFLNTLRLKIALRLTGSSNSALLALADEHIGDVIANDIDMLILDNSQNAKLRWGANNTDNFSIMYERTEINGSDNWRPSISDELMLWSKAYDDPRYTAFAEPSEKHFPIVDDLLDENGQEVEVLYGIPYLGSPVGGSAVYSGWDLNPTQNPLSSATLDHYSEFNDRYTKQDAEFMIISSAETYFMLAEITERGLASTLLPASHYYYTGIDESFERYAPFITVSYDVEEYKNIPGIEYNTASLDSDILYNWTSTSNTKIEENEGLKQIAIQRWITMFFQGHDAWTLQKRTNLLPWAPMMNPADRNTPLDHPERMIYSSADILKSPEEYEEAIQLLQGQDLITTPIEMNKARVPVDWTTFVPEWSNDFGSHWYGPTIGDLEAAGLRDVTDLPSAEQAAAIEAGTGYVRL